MPWGREMTAGSRRAVRGATRVAILLACTLMAGPSPLGLGEGQLAPGPRGAVDPAGLGITLREPDPFATAPEPSATRLALGPMGRDVRLSGELTEGAAERLARLLDDHGSVERIHLTSEGGLVEEGAAIGALIARHGLVTYVPDYCVSACTLAFVRGRERLVLAEARLGFHAPYETGPFGVEIAADSAPERAAYLAAGVEAEFVDAALKVRPDDLMIPDTATLVRAGVATAIVGADRFPDSTLDGADGPDGARSVLLRSFPLLRPIEAQTPWIIDRIADHYRALYGEGASEAETGDRLRRLASRTVLAGMSRAEPEALVALGAYLARAMDKAAAGQPGACAAIGAEGNLFLARRVLGEAGDAGARSILTRALAGTAPIASGRNEAGPPGQALPPAGACADLRRAYGAALGLPLPAAAEALRGLVFGTAPPPALEATAHP